jgi:long-chain acyl-CoA synthetase
MVILSKAGTCAVVLAPVFSLFLSRSCFARVASLVGIIVPDEVVLKRWAADHIKTGRVDVAALCEHEDVRKEIMADLKRVAADAGLRGFEKIKAFHLEAAAWTPDDIASVLTPTFKLKRNVAKERYGKEIEAMYASGIGVVAGRTGVKQE